MKEVWKDVPGYEGIYQASTLGRVRGLISNSHYRRRIMKLTTGTLDYQVVNLYKNKTRKLFGVHIIIARTFIPNPENKRTVNHINGITGDNRVVNLEWATHSENNKHAFDFLNRKITKMFGTDNHRARKVRQLTSEGVELNVFNTIVEAEKITGILNTGITSAARGRRKHAGGYRWEYVE